MKQKLLAFYMDWLLPEIVDSRRARGMPLREYEKTTESPKNDNLEKEPSPKRQRIDEEFLASKDHNNENRPRISRQILFDNF